MFNFGKRKKAEMNKIPQASQSCERTMNEQAGFADALGGIGTQLMQRPGLQVPSDWADAPKYKAAVDSTVTLRSSKSDRLLDHASFVFNTQPGTTMLTPAATEEEATKVADELMDRVTEKMIMLQRLKEGRI